MAEIVKNIGEISGWDKDGESVTETIWLRSGQSPAKAIDDAKKRGGIVEVGQVTGLAERYAD